MVLEEKGRRDYRAFLRMLRSRMFGNIGHEKEAGGGGRVCASRK